MRADESGRTNNLSCFLMPTIYYDSEKKNLLLGIFNSNLKSKVGVGWGKWPKGESAKGGLSERTFPAKLNTSNNRFQSWDRGSVLVCFFFLFLLRRELTKICMQLCPAQHHACGRQALPTGFIPSHLHDQREGSLCSLGTRGSSATGH